MVDESYLVNIYIPRRGSDVQSTVLHVENLGDLRSVYFILFLRSLYGW